MRSRAAERNGQIFALVVLDPSPRWERVEHRRRGLHARVRGVKNQNWELALGTSPIGKRHLRMTVSVLAMIKTCSASRQRLSCASERRPINAQTLAREETQ